MMSDRILITYMREEFPLAERLLRDLRLFGLKSHLDHGPHQTQLWTRPAPGQKTCFIVLISERSCDQQGSLKNRLSFSTRRDRRNWWKDTHIIVARLEDCWPVHGTLPDEPHVDLYPRWEVGLNELITNLRELDINTEAPRDDTRVSIGVVKNGTARYADQIARGFMEGALAGLTIRNYIPVFKLVTGVATKNSTKRNVEVFHGLQRRFGSAGLDYLVTIGTQVSIHAHQHLPGTIPLIFLGVGNPERTGLLQPRPPREGSEQSNLTGATYAPNVKKRLSFLSSLLPNSRIAFLYSSRYIQDEHFAEEVLQLRQYFHGMRFEPIELDRPTIQPALAQKFDAFFGFYFLNLEFESFQLSTDRPIVGIDESDVEFGAVASTGTDDYHLGLLAAERLLVKSVTQETPLGQVPILNDFNARFIVDLKGAKRRGLRIDERDLLEKFPEEVAFINPD
jgi:ABC-type uncharacterized transport system substrate-binding protein